MIDRLIGFALRERLVVLMLGVGMVALGRPRRAGFHGSNGVVEDGERV
ncbi:MAG: hypothetical protein HY303_21665, partial [Candidatus Wallbacteria bacterium]|nr:hypothetical protein [Candidatus Wallbacteria bacterium]